MRKAAVEMSTDTSGAELFNACFDGELDDAVKLLKAGADVDFADEEDARTPLWIASFNGHKDVVRLLLEKGASVHKADNVSIRLILVSGVFFAHCATNA